MAIWSVPSLPNRLVDTGHPPFVGRRRELERLEAIWELVEKGERQAVFLGGEPGSGKSRIALEMARGLHAQDVVVLLGSASLGLSHPYEPLVEALNHLLVATEPGSMAHLLPDNAAELLRVTPHLRLHQPDIDDPLETREEYRLDLFGSYVDLIQAVATDRPVAIFLEDMHWSSAPTRLLMSHLIENTSSTRLLVLATMRSTTPDRSDNLAYTIADLYRLPGVNRIDLSGLDLEDIETYLMTESGSDGNHLREAAALLRDQTGGNPLFLREVWREVARSGGVEALLARRIATPLSVRDSLEGRIRSFDPVCRMVLEHAAVLGTDFSAADLIHAVGVSSGEALKALDHALAMGLIRAMPGGVYSFQHALIRHALIDGLSPSRSAHTHARLAESLAPRYESELDLAPLLARLYEGAGALGYREEMAFYLVEAAEAARRVLAHEEAAALWEKAARAEARDASRREDLLLSAARAHMLAGDFPEARRIYREVNASPDSETALRAAIGFEEASWRPGTLGHESRALLEASIERIPADPTDPLYVNAQISLARSHTFSGDLETSGLLGQEALDMARELGEDDLVADALVAALLRVFNIPQIGGASYQLSTELRKIVMRTGDYDRLGPAGANKASGGYVDSDPQGFRDGWGDVHLAAEKTGQPFWRWVDGCYQYCHEFMSGDFSAAAASAARINELGYSFGTNEAEGPFGLQMYMVQRETGALESVRSLISGDPSNDGTWVPGLLSLYAELGMTDSVRGLLDSSLALPDTTRGMAVYPAVVAFLTEAALFVGNVEAVERLLPHMEQYDGLNILVPQCVAVFGSGNTYLGRMHAMLGNRDVADAHFRRALQMDVAVESIVHQTATLAHHAAFLETVDEPERADGYRTMARQAAGSIGQVRVLRLLDRTAAADIPDGLTVREVEVLRLLVEGASNKQIGDRLFISSNTAANHVRNILLKTGSPNRTAAAVYATERGLI